MSDNPGLRAVIQDEIQNFLSDSSNIPQGVFDQAAQYVAMNPVPVQATISPTIIASGVGSSSNSPTRYVGGTASGAPASGTYVAGDFVVSHDGHIYICTVAGTPGTWSTWPAQGEISFRFITSSVAVASTTATSPTTIISGSTVAYTGVDVYVEVFAGAVSTPTVAGGSTNLQLWDGIPGSGGSCQGVLGVFTTPTAAQAISPFYAQIKRTPSAGNHTYGLYAFATSTTGTPTVSATTGSTTAVGPAFLRVRYA